MLATMARRRGERATEAPIAAARIVLTVQGAPERSLDIVERMAIERLRMPDVPLTREHLVRAGVRKKVLTYLKTLLSWRGKIRILLYGSLTAADQAVVQTCSDQFRHRAEINILVWPQARDVHPDHRDILIFHLPEYLYGLLPSADEATRRAGQRRNVWISANSPRLGGVFLQYTPGTALAPLRQEERLKRVAADYAGTQEVFAAWLASDNHVLDLRDVRLTDLSDGLTKLLRRTLHTANPDVLPPRSRYTLQRSLQWMHAGLRRVYQRVKRRHARGTECTKMILAADLGGRIPDWPTPLIERVSLSAFAPALVAPTTEFILQIWMYPQDAYHEVLTWATAVQDVRQTGLKRGIVTPSSVWVRVSVAIPTLGISGPEERMYWDGDAVNATFAISVPAEVRIGTHVGTAAVEVGGVPLATLHFEVAVGPSVATPPQLLPSVQRLVRTVFASYATPDRTEVLRWARGAAAVGVDVFVDVLTLRAGADWELQLFREIPMRDLFCLFWSRPASESPWVECEWRCALAARGLEYIHPVALVDPRVVPPPLELRAKHFNDPLRSAIAQEDQFHAGT